MDTAIFPSACSNRLGRDDLFPLEDTDQPQAIIRHREAAAIRGEIRGWQRAEVVATFAP